MGEGSTYHRRPGVDASHGSDFEWKSTLLAYLKCVEQHEEWKGTKNSGVKSFFVANNMDGVGAFDDVVVRKEIVRDGETQTKLTFTQCKHVAGNPNKVRKYVNKGEIQKYFDSFIEVYKIFVQDDTAPLNASAHNKKLKLEENENVKRLELQRLFNCQFSDCEFSFVTNIEFFPEEFFENVKKNSENVEIGPISEIINHRARKEYKIRSEKCLGFLLYNELPENGDALICQFCNVFRILSIPDHETNLEIEDAVNKLCVGEIQQNIMRETLLEEAKLTLQASKLLNESTDAHNNIKDFVHFRKLTETKIARNKQTISTSEKDATEIVSKYHNMNETEFHRLAQNRIYRSFHYLHQKHLCIIVGNKDEYRKWESARSTFKYGTETKIYTFFENYDLPPMVELANEQFINLLHKNRNQCDSTVFKQLYENEVCVIKNAKILFQGHEIALKELNSNLGKVLDENAVCDILESKQLAVGTELPGTPNIYIERKLRIKVLTEEIRKILADFVRSAQGEQHSKFLLLSRWEKSADQPFEKCDEKTKNSCKYMENIDKARKYLPELLKQNDFNHYLCTHLNGNLKLQFMTWNETNESNNFEVETVDENFLIDGRNTEKTTILSDVAGMGKSTTMLNLAVEYKKNNKSSWVHYIQLGKYSNDFEKAKSIHCNAVNFLASTILKLGGFDFKLFTDACNKTGNIALFLDGFDELVSRARYVFSELLLALEETEISKIFVSCRQNTLRDLEKITLKNAISFLELSFDEKVNCLLEIWKSNLAETGDNIENEELEKIAERIIKDTESERNSIKKILAIPLQIKMFAGAFFEEMLECFKLNSVFNFRFDISNLYKNFIHSHAIHYHAKSITDWNDWHQDKRNKYIREKLKGVPEFVCSLIVPHLVESNENDMKDNIENLRDDLGLITDDSQTPPLFLHKTIAEYLAAEFIVKQFLVQINDKIREQVFESVLTEDGYDILRKFINSILDENNFPAYFHRNDSEMKTSRREYTAFHAAASEENFTLMKALLKRDESCINQKYTRGWIALHAACNNNRTEVVKFLLCHGSLLTVRDDDGHTAFHNAAGYGHTDIMDLLLSHEPLLLNMCDKWGRTPLHFACAYNSLAAAKLLINNHCPVVQRDDDGETAFHFAACENNTEIMDLLLSHEPLLLNMSDNWERSPLHFTCAYNSLAAAKLLLNNRCLVIQRNGEGATAFHVAAKEGHTEIMELLLSHEPSLLNMCDKWGRTPLHHACENNKLAATEFLLNHSCSVTIRNDFGDNSFHVAVKEGHTEIMHLLLTHNPSLLNLRDVWGVTPLYYACLCNHPAAAEILLNHNCSVYERDCAGNTALHLVAIQGNIPVMELLLKNCKSMINVTDNHGVIPLQKAIFHDKFDAVKFLLREGSSVKNRDNDGDTVFNEAAIRNNVEAMELLLQYDRTLLNEANDKGETPLHQACSEGKVEAATFLLANKDCSTIAYNCYGYTAFHEAVKNGHIKILEMFLQYDHSFLSTKTSDDKSPLQIACMKEKTDAFSVLKNVDFSINFRGNICNLIIFYAAWKEQIETKDLAIKLKKHYVPGIEISLYLTCSEGQIDCRGFSKYLINQDQLHALM